MGPGAAVRLFDPTDKLGIAEGIETAIAAHELFDVPTWATISSTIIESFSPPAGIRRLVIFADHDRNCAGQKAAFTLAHRLHRDLKLDVEVKIPPEPDSDWLDVLNSSRRRVGMSAAKTNIGFTKIPDELMDSQAWRTAPLGVRCVVLEIWRRHNGNNNGKIPYSRRDAQADLGCGPHQAVRYLAEAQERGFIEAICQGTRTRKGDTRAATTWRLTMERYGRRDPTKEWASWARPEIELPVPERYRCPDDRCRSDTRPVPERYRYPRNRCREPQLQSAP